MNWITNYVRPRINSLFSRREVPENLWTKCPECGTMLFHRELAENLNVCTNCDHHLAISPRDRFAALFDGIEIAAQRIVRQGAVTPQRGERVAQLLRRVARPGAGRDEARVEFARIAGAG